MRLINTRDLGLEEYPGGLVPNYAILSHTWGDKEVSLQDWSDARSCGKIESLYGHLLRDGFQARALPARISSAQNAPIADASSLDDPSSSSSSAGNITGWEDRFSKILMACVQARGDGFDYLWVDTNCIDKTSSAELSEAINSMYAWYHSSSICYAYLSDVDESLRPEGSDDPDILLRQSRWFKRGWTLQELLAPREVVFFSADWTEIGRKDTMTDVLSEITGIDPIYLRRICGINGASIAQRMSWVANRITTRPEDIAYCLLGIFDVSMPLLYGEGSKAFVRLQEEIIKVSEDHSIFAWTWIPELSGPLMRGNRRNEAIAIKMRNIIAATAPEREAKFPTHRLDALMANTLWQDPMRPTMLAPDPLNFFDSGKYGYLTPGQDVKPFVMTNAGLTLELPLIHHMEPGLVFAVLHYELERLEQTSHLVCVPIVCHPQRRNRHTRTWFPRGPITIIQPGCVSETKELRVCRDVQHVPFYYPGFSGTSHRYGFWLVTQPSSLNGYTLLNGYTTPSGVFNGHGIFFDAPPRDRDNNSAFGGGLVIRKGLNSALAGGLLVFGRPRSSFIVVFLGISFVFDIADGKDRLTLIHHCEVILAPGLDGSEIAIANLYLTMTRRYFDTPSNRISSAGEYTVMMRNECLLSHATDARIVLTEIITSPQTLKTGRSQH